MSYFGLKPYCMKIDFTSRFFLIAFFSLFAFSGSAQNSKDSVSKHHFKTGGLLVGYGPTFSDNTKYTVYYVTGDFSWSLGRAAKKDFVSIYFEPQLNAVRTDNPWDFEVGANLGIRNFIRINSSFYLYQMLGSGPHYISADLERQATGFIFSDNLALGSMISFHNGPFLNLQFGIRHISNANLKLPNRGVNSFTFRAGLSQWSFGKPFWKRRQQ